MEKFNKYVYAITVQSIYMRLCMLPQCYHKIKNNVCSAHFGRAMPMVDYDH